MSVIPFGRLFAEIDNRAGSGNFPLLSVSIERGVIARENLTDRPTRTDDLSNYKVCLPGDIVLNRMRAFQGALGLVHQAGAVSPDYAVLRPNPHTSGAFLAYVMRSAWFIGAMTARLRGIGDPALGSVRTPRVNVDGLRDIEIRLPPIDRQRGIADFLDDRLGRIDQIIASRREQQSLLAASLVRASFDTIKGSDARDRRNSGLAWLGSVPASWPILTVTTEFQVDLGKMLDEKRQTGEWSIPYLRNTNVQWDLVDTGDLKTMDIGASERERYCVRHGDLLICEGGQPGRSAVWLGDTAPLGYQKALHRARTRGRSNPHWLLECLRVAANLNVFAVENGQTTIGHLTNEQLRSLRLPFPTRREQDRLLEALSARQSQVRATLQSLSTSVGLLQEYKQSLITAAVAGDIDVTTVGSGIQG